MEGVHSVGKLDYSITTAFFLWLSEKKKEETHVNASCNATSFKIR